MTAKQLKALRRRQTEQSPPAPRIPLTRWARDFSKLRPDFFEELEAAPKENLSESLACVLKVFRQHRKETRKLKNLLLISLQAKRPEG